MKYHDSLYPPQQKAYDKIMVDLLGQGYAILKAGMRSGKNNIASAIVENSKHTHLCLLSHGNISARTVLPVELRRGVLWSLPKKDNLPADSKVLVLIDNPFWYGELRAKFDQAREQGYTVFAFGSNGPEYPKWANLGGHGYAVWELNPKITREKALSFAGSDMKRFERDYGKF